MRKKVERLNVNLGIHKARIEEMAESEARTLSAMTKILLDEALQIRDFLRLNNFRERLLLHAGQEKNVIFAIKIALTEWLQEKEKAIINIQLVGTSNRDLSNFLLSPFAIFIKNHRLELVEKGIFSSLRAEQLAAGHPPIEEEIEAVAQALNLTIKELCNQESS